MRAPGGLFGPRDLFDRATSSTLKSTIAGAAEAAITEADMLPTGRVLV
jgi:hypothetical protein